MSNTPSPTNKNAEAIASMFNKIAERYDFLNSFLSLGIHKIWRKKSIQFANPQNPVCVLDIATGTADFAIETLNIYPQSQVMGIDISSEMLKIGQQKIINKKLQSHLTIQIGDAETIDFKSASYDLITIGFGVRNFDKLDVCLQNINRMMKSNATLCILEFTKPTKFPIVIFYKFYLNVITPVIGKLFAKDKEAYSYLPNSINTFPCNNEFIAILNANGFKNTSYKTMALGLVAVYKGQK